jgi:hypothetical protein
LNDFDWENLSPVLLFGFLTNVINFHRGGDAMHDREIIETRLASTGLSLVQLSAYSGVGTSRLSPWLSGLKQLPAPVWQQVYETLINLEKLQLAVGEDFPLDFRTIEKIKTLLSRMRAGEVLGVAARAAREASVS